MKASNSRWNWHASLTAVVFLLAVVAAIPQPGHAITTVTDENLAAALASAATAADHEALAAHFRSKAEQEAAAIAKHEAMLANLKGKGKVYNNFLPHCRSIIHSAHEAKEAYEKLADQHAAMAEAASQ
jgi:hypothetical protein